MARHYGGGSRDQSFLMPVNMRDWLDEGHLAWFVVDVVAAIDTRAFHARHANSGPGRPAYDPDMMLALLFYAYGTGVRSSRRIEALCRTDAAFRVITGGSVPDHATLARFVVDHERAVTEVFVAVLRLCAAAGLASVGTIAIDGTKMGCDASLDANRGRAAITAELGRLRAEVESVVAEARAIDTAEDGAQLFGVDRLPADLASRSGRQARLEAALASIEAADAADAADAAARAAAADGAAVEGKRLRGRKPKDPPTGVARAAADVIAVQNRNEAVLAERAAKRAAAEHHAAAEGRTLQGRPPGGLRGRERDQLETARQRLAAARSAAADATAVDRKVNITDPDSRIMKNVAGGYLQGYNAQAAVNEHHIVLAACVTQDANDVGQYQPMVAATQANLAAAGVTADIGVILADAGYSSEDNNTADGPQRLIATQKDWKQRRAARNLGTTTGPPPPDATPAQAMEHRLRTPEGAAAYAKRSHTVEPVFGHTKENRGWRRFRRRGLSAATSEWALMTASHNITNLFNHQPA